MDKLPQFALDSNPFSKFAPVFPFDLSGLIPKSAGNKETTAEHPSFTVINPAESPLIVRIGTQRHEIMPSVLENEDGNNHWHSILEEAEEIPIISLENLLAWEHEERWQVLLFSFCCGQISC